MDTRAYILDLLSRGASATDVARLANCSPSYISQLQGDEQFAAELSEKRAVHAAERDGRAQKVQKIHQNYLELEEILLQKLSVQAKAGLLKPIEQMKLLQVVASKKEPLNPLENTQTAAPASVTQITLPVQIAAQFVINHNKEIIGTDSGQSFAPMSTKGLQEMAAKRALPAPKEQLNKTEDILRMFSLNPNAEKEIKF